MSAYREQAETPDYQAEHVRKELVETAEHAQEMSKRGARLTQVLESVRVAAQAGHGSISVRVTEGEQQNVYHNGSPSYGTPTISLRELRARGFRLDAESTIGTCFYRITVSW